ncbi:MAG: hypothetical protein ACRYFS_09775 [Janthinobacterium lividum]
MAIDLHDPAARRHFYIQMAKKRVRPGSGSGPETLWARTWRRPVFDLRTITSVPFVVIGGVATRLYAPERVTDDLDILIKAQDSATLADDIERTGSSSRCEVNGMALDILEEDASWAAEAIANPASAPNGLPVISLPYLVLMKMRSSRGIDIGDLTRILGAADDAAIAEVSRVVAVYLPDGVEDLEGLIYLGRLEYGMPH